MTLQEAKEQWAVENGWENWIDFQFNRPPDTYISVIHHLAEQLIESAAKEARSAAIDECVSIIDNNDYRLNSLRDHEEVRAELLNLKEKK